MTYFGSAEIMHVLIASERESVIQYSYIISLSSKRDSKLTHECNSRDLRMTEPIRQLTSTEDLKYPT